MTVDSKDITYMGLRLVCYTPSILLCIAMSDVIV